MYIRVMFIRYHYAILELYVISLYIERNLVSMENNYYSYYSCSIFKYLTNVNKLNEHYVIRYIDYFQCNIKAKRASLHFIKSGLMKLITTEHGAS